MSPPPGRPPQHTQTPDTHTQRERRTSKSAHRKAHNIADLAIVAAKHDPDDGEGDHADDDDGAEHEDAARSPAVAELEPDAAVLPRQPLAVVPEPRHPHELARRDRVRVLQEPRQLRAEVPSEQRLVARCTVEQAVLSCGGGVNGQRSGSFRSGMT